MPLLDILTYWFRYPWAMMQVMLSPRSTAVYLMQVRTLGVPPQLSDSTEDVTTLPKIELGEI